MIFGEIIEEILKRKKINPSNNSGFVLKQTAFYEAAGTWRISLRSFWNFSSLK